MSMMWNDDDKNGNLMNILCTPKIMSSASISISMQNLQHYIAHLQFRLFSSLLHCQLHCYIISSYHTRMHSEYEIDFKNRNIPLDAYRIESMSDKMDLYA